MCGICGVITSSCILNDKYIIRMRDALVTRGPDGSGFYISQDGKVGLGHRRLKIIDLSENARQPMSNEDGSIWLTCNGEIYNYKALKAALLKAGHKFISNFGIETIIHLYEDYGIELLQKIDGDFAFCLWDEVNQKLFIARDRLGVKPCFYYSGPDRLIFASEIKAILKDPTVPTTINPVALHHYLTFLSIPEPHTIYKEIQKLPPGFYLEIDKNNIKLVDYSRLDEIFSSISSNKKEEDYIEEFIFFLKKSIKKRLLSDVPLGVYLSGGIDSSTIVALMNEIGISPKTFSVIFGDKYTCDESRYSREIAKLFCTDHHELVIEAKSFDKLPEIISYFDEPFAIPSAVPLYFLSEFARHKIKVVLTGDGGDELFAGYSRYYWDKIGEQFHRLGFGPLAKKVSKILAGFPFNFPFSNLSKGKDLAQKLLASISMEPDKRYLSYFTYFSEEMKNSIYADYMRENSDDIDSVRILQKHYERISNSDILTKRIYGDIRTTLAHEMLTKGDRMAMAHSIENRVPFLDQDLLEFSARLPNNLKLRGKIGKYIVKKAMCDRLPQELLYRRKKGFNVPLGRWLRSEMLGLTLDYLDEKKIKKDNIFDPNSVKSLVQRFICNIANLEYYVYPLLVFCIWYKECYKQSRGSLF